VINKILVPLDGSPSAEAVLPEIQSLAEKFQAEVVLMKVVASQTAQLSNPVPDLARPAVAMSRLIPSFLPEAINTENVYVDDVVVHNTAEANDYLSGVARTLARRGLKVTVAMRPGKAAEAILSLAREEDVDLIVMSTRARSQASKTFRGSVPEKVLRESKVPVILVKPTPAALAKAKLLRYPEPVAAAC
jgi:nucleotide-binding universal stress UspA family protein